MSDRRASLAALAVTGLVAAGLVPLAGLPAAASPDRPDRPAPSARPWAVPDRSVSRAPEKVVRGVGPRERARVVAVTVEDGRPQVEITPVRGADQAAAAVRAAQREPDLLSVEVDSRVRALAADPYRDYQWGLDRLGAEEVWEASRGSGVTVAVVDSGVDAAHPDLAGQVLSGAEFLDLSGSSTGDGREDGDGHGTHVAGTIAAVAGNGVGVAGMAPDVRILPVRVLDENGDGYLGDLLLGIRWAVDNGADVLNLSLGGPSHSPALEIYVSWALAQDVVVVAAAGNDGDQTDPETGRDPLSYPAAYDGVVGVAATDAQDRLAWFSSKNEAVDVAAPGVDVLATYPTALTSEGYAPYAWFDGTSMAAPFVAATAAILRAADPTATQGEVAAALLATADDLGPAGRDDLFGHGLVDPDEALCVLLEECAPPTPTESPDPGPTSAPSAGPAATAFVLGAVPARPVRHGSRVPVVATLVSGGRPLTGAAVHVHVTRQGRRTTYLRTTDAQGRVGVTLRLTRATQVAFTRPSTPTTTAAYAARLLRVRPDVRVRAKRSTLRVRVAGAARQKVTLQRREGRRWVVVDRRRAVKRFRFTGLAAGRYRVVVAAAPGLERALGRGRVR